MPEKTNNKDYWDRRFSSDWDSAGGPDQSKFFSRLALKLLPPWFVEYVEKNRPAFCDWGCAEGDGTDVLASLFGHRRTHGVDFSIHAVRVAQARYPALQFREEDWLAVVPPAEPDFDVVFSSNTLEHFQKPFEVLQTLTRHARDFVVLLLPYRELERHPEHLATFLDGNIPLSPRSGWSLIHARNAATSDIEDSRWMGEQILLIYGNHDAIERSGLTLTNARVFPVADKADEDSLLQRLLELEMREQALGQQLETERQQAVSTKEKMGDLQAKLRSGERELDEQSKEKARLQAQIESISETLTQQQSLFEKVAGELDAAKQTLAARDESIEQLKAEINHKLTYIQDKESYIAALKGELANSTQLVGAIIGSASWRLTAPLRAVLSWVLPRRFPRYTIPVSGALAGSGTHNRALKAGSESSRYRDFNPYDHVTALKPITVVATDVSHAGLAYPPGFTVICTILNEAGSIDRFLDSLGKQTLAPDAIIFVDGGSKDDTVGRIEAWAEQATHPVRVIMEPGASIANGRNIAIGQSEHEVIVAVDAGCVLDPDYCRELVGALSDHPDTDMVGGIYKANNDSPWSRYFVYDWSSCDWDAYLPSSRSLLIRKSIWEKCGGYPEHLTRTGEDTLFDLNYRRFSRKWVFSKRAFVHWDCPEDEAAATRLARAYGYGDGESGFGDYAFYGELKAYRQVVMSEGGSSLDNALRAGYLDGRASRPRRTLLDARFRGVALILSGVPISDSGGGQRCTQLALELAHQGYKVIFVNIYPSFESAHRVFLDVDPFRLDLYALSDFNIREHFAPYFSAMSESFVLVEFPHPDFLPVLAELRSLARRPRIIYDYIDNWQTSLGWTWYTPEIESEIIALCDQIVASADSLKKQIALREGRGAHLVANAFNARLFNSRSQHDRPQDISGIDGPIVMYIGALWGGWFDWELLLQCARELGDRQFVLIGNATDEIKARAATLPNVHCLGLKLQRELPGYLMHADVCIIPFKEDDVTRFVNPLKVYEYLAMQAPVVSTCMPELVGMPGVVVCSTPTEFIEAVRDADRRQLDASAINGFLDANNWGSRVEKLIGIIQGRHLPVTDMLELSAVSTTNNPVAHWEGVLSIKDGVPRCTAANTSGRGAPHEPELHLVSVFNRPDDLLLDVGANIGQTITSVRTVNADIPITCFEPNPFLASHLEGLAKSLDKVEVHAIALSSQKGQHTLWMPVVDGLIVTPLASFDLNVLYEVSQLDYIRGLSVSGDVRLLPVEVRMQQGDDFDLKPTVIKIDVEGFEPEVVEGLRNTILRSKPMLIVERSYRSGELAQSLLALGYRAHTFDGRDRLTMVALTKDFASFDWPLNIVFIHGDTVGDLQQRGLRFSGQENY